jgi:hypothetical protein
MRMLFLAFHHLASLHSPPNCVSSEHAFLIGLLPFLEKVPSWLLLTVAFHSASLHENC